MAETSGPSCPSCTQESASDLVILATRHWRVAHGPPATTRGGGLKITSVRHFVDFADMDEAEQASFGPLLHRLDRAVREVSGAERVHLVSTRDRVQHFHAWLYPRLAGDELRGTAFLAAPQSTTAADAAEVSARLRTLLPRTDGVGAAS